jgi:AraC-like DNA-binding protein
MKIDFPEARLDNPTQCLALAIDNQKIITTLNFLNEKYPKDGRDNFWKLDERNYFFYNNEDLASTINKLIEICQSKSITKDVLADLTLQELLIRIIQTQTLKAYDNNEVKETSSYLSQVINIIKNSLVQKINLNIIAKNAGMSTATLYRLFKKELGISPIEYIMLERIKIAKKLLKDQNLYIKNVSFEAGFDDCNYFIRAFKQYEGITPRQYQQMQG